MAPLYTLVLLIAQLLSLARGCNIFLDDPYGNMTSDLEQEVGSKLVLRCMLFEDKARHLNVSSTDLIMKHKGKVVNASVFDEYTLVYTVFAAVEKDSGPYSCLVKNIPNHTDPQYVCNSVVSIGYKPLPVENFSCSGEELATLTCTWKASLNPVPTKYFLYDYLGDAPSAQRECRNRTKSSCRFGLDTKPPYMKDQAVLHFALVGANSLGNNTEYFSIPHFSIVKPAPPKAVQTFDIGINTITLRIVSPRHLDHGEFANGLVYSVKYYSVSTFLNIVKEVFVQARTDGNVTLENLVPHTQYVFVVRCRLNVSGEDFLWSDVTTATDDTDPDVPYLPPEVTASGFDVETTVKSRTVTIYWKPVPSAHENGPDFGYTLYYHLRHTRGRRSLHSSHSTEIRVGNVTSYSVKGLDAHSAYLFEIMPTNAMGNGTNTSTILVDKTEKLLPGPRDITVVSGVDSRYNLSWRTPPLLQSITHHTVFWCAAMPSRPGRCASAPHWLHTRQLGELSLTLPPNKSYRFAISINNNFETSGMYWASCIANYDDEYHVKQLRVSPKNATSLTVSWSLDCEAQKKIAKQYELRHCSFLAPCSNRNALFSCIPEDVHKWVQVRLNNASLEEHTLTLLRPHTCYALHMRILTNSGWGKDSPLVVGETKPSAPGGPPRNVSAEVQDTLVIIHFASPLEPNGDLTSYRVLLNASSNPRFNIANEFPASSINNGTVFIEKNVHYFTNYSVEVSACVDQECSPMSEPVYVGTRISIPGQVPLPRLELTDHWLNVSWKPPFFPNGPISYYELLVQGRGNDSRHLFNTSDDFIGLERDCNVWGPGNMLDFRVRAVNYDENDQVLYGNFSSAASSVICTSDKNVLFYVGLTAGVLAAAVVFIGIIYILAHRMLTSYNEAKNIKIQLPRGLESPLDDPLDSFRLKGGLEREYDTLFQEGEIIDRANGCVFITQEKERQESGDCQESVSSANTTKTHVSVDSGAPADAMSDDSAHSAAENNGLSRDSGLEHDTPKFVCASSDLTSRGVWYTKAPLFPSEAFDRVSLSNSEPSLVDFENDAIHPYSKLGDPCLARSAGSGIEQLVPASKHHYSKFGTAVSVCGKTHDAQVFVALTSTRPSAYTPFFKLCPDSDDAATINIYSRFGMARPTPLPSKNNAYSLFGVLPTNKRDYHFAKNKLKQDFESLKLNNKVSPQKESMPSENITSKVKNSKEVLPLNEILPDTIERSPFECQKTEPGLSSEVDGTIKENPSIVAKSVETELLGTNLVADNAVSECNTIPVTEPILEPVAEVLCTEPVHEQNFDMPNFLECDAPWGAYTSITGDARGQLIDLDAAAEPLHLDLAVPTLGGDCSATVINNCFGSGMPLNLDFSTDPASVNEVGASEEDELDYAIKAKIVQNGGKSPSNGYVRVDFDTRV